LCVIRASRPNKTQVRATPLRHRPHCIRAWPDVNVGSVKIEKGRRVQLKVDLSVAGGQQLEKSTVEYIQGAGTMLPGLERVLEGLEPGAKRDGVLKAKDAFGNSAMHPLKKMKRTEFPKDAKLVEGEKLVAASADKAKMNVILQVVKITADDVEVRLVHPLADKDIKYAVEVVQVSDPRPPPVPVQALDLEEEK
jgi:FKBP-type peptidyl-prolyl cis-trans isomerase 2